MTRGHPLLKSEVQNKRDPKNDRSNWRQQVTPKHFCVKITDKTVQNYFKKAGFCEIEEDDAVSDDPFAVLKDTVTQLINLDKTFEDVTVEDVTSFDDTLVSTQGPLSDEDILAGFLPIDVHAQHESDDEEDS